MTFASLSRRLALLATLASSLVLVACGGGGGDSGSGTTNLRAINLTTDLATVDLFTNDTKRFTALATDTLASRLSFDAGTYTLGVRRVGDGVSLFSESFSLTRDRNFTALITGREATLVVRTLPEDEDNNAIAAGQSRVRMFNLTGDTAGIDVFITADNVDIGDKQPTARLTSNTLGDFRELPTGAYRLRVTGVGNPTDLRLDVPVTLADRKHATLVLTSGPGGSLVNATLIEQQGAATTLKNTKARVRVAAGVDSIGNVSASVAGATLVGSLRSPGVGAYLLVDAGARDLTVRVNGNPVRSGNFSFAPGADYTVLAFGALASPRVNIISDDNRLPNTSSRAKLRLVNGLAGAELITMQLDFLPLAADIGSGVASGYATAASTGSTRLDVTSPAAVDPLFSATAASNQPLLQAQGVYTVFMLGGQAAPTGILRRDR